MSEENDQTGSSW